MRWIEARQGGLWAETTLMGYTWAHGPKIRTLTYMGAFGKYFLSQYVLSPHGSQQTSVQNAEPQGFLGSSMKSLLSWPSWTGRSDSFQNLEFKASWVRDVPGSGMQGLRDWLRLQRPADVGLGVGLSAYRYSRFLLSQLCATSAEFAVEGLGSGW